MSGVQKVTVSPLADITSIMAGTTAPWPWEVTAVYINGTVAAFTWAAGIVSIPSYTTGVVTVEFNLYLIFGAPSQYLPSDPTNPLSAPAFWENRLTNFIAYSTSIKSFEVGLTEVTIGSMTLNIDDDWLPLIQQVLIFTNRIVRIYIDDVIKFKGITTRASVNNFQLSISIQKRQTILDSQCSWGDPDYLNRINRASSNAYYTGSNIPEQFENYAIPMLFGFTTPYELNKVEEIDLGTPSAFFIVPPSTKGRSRGVNTNVTICKVIPTSSSGGILGRMPSYQTMPAAAPINEALANQSHRFGRYEQASNPNTLNFMILGENCVLDRTTPGIINAARLFNRQVSPARSLFFMGYDDLSAVNYDNISNCDKYRHFFTTEIPRETWTTPAILSSTLTPAGHRWLTISGVTGLNLLETDCYVVINNISGAKSGPDVMKWALEAHGFTTEPTSFAAMNLLYPDRVCMQAGFGTSLQTLGSFLAEINRSLLTVLVFPASNDAPFLVRIDPTQAATQIIDERQIDNISSSSEYRDQAKNVIFEPAYFRSDIAKADLSFNLPAPNAALWGSEKTVRVTHVLAELSDTVRFEEMTDFFGSPVTTVKFMLLDDEVTLELADIVQIDHPEFQQKILITSIEQQPLGRLIQGRYLYVNQN